MSHPNDWVQLNDDNQTAIPPITTSGGGGGSSAPRNNDQLLDHGRGARPIRRRSRASRRTPTTFLNTDTTNFRAMVQQFTGGPATTAPASASPHLTSAARGIFDFRQQIVPNQGGGDHVQYPFPNQVHMQQRLYVGDTHGRGGGGAHAPPESRSPNGSRGHDNFMF